MTDAGPENFDDPALKSAICRCWRNECASTELRAKVAQLLQGTDEADTASDAPAATQTVFRIPQLTWILATAAVIVLALGLSFRFWLPTHGTNSRQSPAPLTVAISPSLLNDLVVRHDLCSSEPDHHHLSVPKNDDAAIAGALETQLGHAVLVARPFDPGWTFRGASICPVGTAPGGHLVFVRDNDTFSIFSLPHAVAPQLKDGDQFAMTLKGHSIAGFEKDGALFCLVARSPAGTLTPDDLQKMRSQMESDVTVARADVAGKNDAVAELLHPGGD